MLPAVCIHIFLYSLHCLQYSELLQVLQHFNWDGDWDKLRGRHKALFY